jgi:hypothetical protein
MSFFVSEVIHLQTAKPYLTKTLAGAKTGAVLLVKDNSTPSVFELVDNVAAYVGFNKLAGDVEDARIFDRGEELAKLQKYTSKFDTSSKLKGQTFWRVFLKG